MQIFIINMQKNDLIYILKSHEIPGNYNSNITNFDKQYDNTPFNYKNYINVRNNNVKKDYNKYSLFFSSNYLNTL